MPIIIKKFIPTKNTIGSIVMWQIKSTPNSYMSVGILVKILNVKIVGKDTIVEIIPIAGDNSCIWLINPDLESTEVNNY